MISDYRHPGIFDILPLNEWLLRLGATLFFSGLAALLMFDRSIAPATPTSLTLVSGCVLFSGYLFLSAPPLSRVASLRTAILCSLSMSMCLGLLLVTPPFGTATFQQLAKLTGAVFLVSLCCNTLLLLLSTLWSDRQAASVAVLIFFCQAASAPLWLGPALESQFQGLQAANAVVAVSPVSYLASMVDYDYLHGSWFYQHTPLGSFRYDYPNGISISIAYLSVSLLFIFLRHVLVTKSDAARFVNNR